MGSRTVCGNHDHLIDSTRQSGYPTRTRDFAPPPYDGFAFIGEFLKTAHKILRFIIAIISIKNQVENLFKSNFKLGKRNLLGLSISTDIPKFFAAFGEIS